MKAWNVLPSKDVVEKTIEARAAYGLPAEFRTCPSKVLLFQREVQPGRVKVIIVNQVVGN